MIAAATRRSPLADWQATHPDVTADAPVWLQDCSWHQRFGCKGPDAGEWLKSQGLTVPLPTNGWAQDANGILVARLATSEFLVEAFGAAQEDVEAMRARIPASRVYPVIRQDAAFVLGGGRANDLLLETCSYPFENSPVGKVIMTSMVGVGVTVIPQNTGTTTAFRIWCDPSFGLYLWSTLVEIATEMGGGAITFRGES